MTAPSLGFDPARLEAFIHRSVPGLDAAPMALERIAGGQSNPTFALAFGGTRLVLRKKPAGPLLPSAHRIDREYRVMQALAKTAVPIPEMVLYCADASVIGTEFYLMRWVEGRVFHHANLPGLAPADRGSVYRSLAQVLAALHAVRPGEVGLADFGRTGNYFARQIGLWGRQWQASRQSDDPNIARLLAWLPENIPDDTLTTLTHGDFRVGNVILAPDRPEIAALLDWELSTLGHPLADLAHCAIIWHYSEDEYGGLLGQDLGRLGIPERAAFEEEYYARATHGQRLEPFHLAFALFRFAVIFEGIAARVAAGNAADAGAASHAHLSRTLAERAVAFVR